MPNSFTHWIQQQRSSTRLAYILQMLTRTGAALLSLVWTPLLIGAMGRTLYGTFLSFQSVATLGSLGDLGMGGAINIAATRLIGQNDTSTLKRYLAVARAGFFIMAVLVGVVFVVLAPWLPRWLGFEPLPGTGSLTLLFVVGGIAAGCVIVNSYTTNLNYGLANMAWPILPIFVLVQLSILSHWLLARAGTALWVQYLPYVGANIVGSILGWLFIRHSHREVSSILRFAFDWPTLVDIVAKSFWVYIYCIGSTVYIITDRLLINAYFDAAMVPSYQLNFKLCELALFVIGTASLVSMPKIGAWAASPDLETRQRARRETARLARFQTFLGCSAVLVYAAMNDWFIRLWLGDGFQVPFSWQIAFAANMVVTAAGYAGFELAPRCSPRGVKVGGMIVAVGAAIKVAGSCWAVQQGSILGIAWSTVVSQSFVVLACSWFSFRTVGLSWWRLAFKGWVVAVSFVALAALWHSVFSTRGGLIQAGVAMAAVLLLLVAGKVLGITFSDIRGEIGAFTGLLRKPGLPRPGGPGL